MIVVVAVLAVALVVVAVVAVMAARACAKATATARRATADRDDQVQRAGQERSAATTAGIEAEQRAAQAGGRADQAEQRANEAEQRAADASRRADEAESEVATRTALDDMARIARGRLDALWQLTVLAASNERRRADDLSTAPPSGDLPQDLAEILGVEVERFREEVGTPGSLRVSLDPPPDSGLAAVMARSVQLLLETLARHCQGYDIALERRTGHLEAVVVCEGYDGPDDALTDETTALSAALGPARGDVEVDRDDEGRLRAWVTLATEASDAAD